MPRKSSASFNSGTKTSMSNAKHNDRSRTPKYIFDYNAKNEYDNSAKEVQREFKKLDRQVAKRRKELGMKKVSTQAHKMKELVINLEAHHTLKDLDKISNHLEEKYGFKVLQKAIHRDEGLFLEKLNCDVKNWDQNDYNYDKVKGWIDKSGKVDNDIVAYRPDRDIFWNEKDKSWYTDKNFSEKFDTSKMQSRKNYHAHIIVWNLDKEGRTIAGNLKQDFDRLIVKQKHNQEIEKLKMQGASKDEIRRVNTFHKKELQERPHVAETSKLQDFVADALQMQRGEKGRKNKSDNIHKFKADAENLDRAKAKLREQKAKQSKENTELKAEVQKLKLKVGEVRSELQDLKTKRIDANKLSREADKGNLYSADEQRELNKLIKSLNAKNINDVYQKLQELKAEHKKRVEEIKELEETNQKLSKSDEALQDIKKEISGDDDTKDRDPKEVVEKVANIKREAEKAEKYRTQKNELAEVVNKKVVAVAELQTTLEEKQAELTEAREQRDTLSKELQEIKKQQDSLQSERAKLEQMKADIEDRLEQNAEESKKLEEVKQTVRSTKEAQALKAEIASNRKLRLDELEAKYTTKTLTGKKLDAEGFKAEVQREFKAIQNEHKAIYQGYKKQIQNMEEFIHKTGNYIKSKWEQLKTLVQEKKRPEANKETNEKTKKVLQEKIAERQTQEQNKEQEKTRSRNNRDRG